MTRTGNLQVRIMARRKWYQAGLRFTCTQCGNCCSGPPGYVWVTKKEIARIAEHLKRPAGQLDKRELRRVGMRYSLTEWPGGDCIFLTRDGGRIGCLIYPVRPLQCRTWPFWNQNLRSPDTWNHAHENCPGMNTGKFHDLDAIEKIRTQREW